MFTSINFVPLLPSWVTPNPQPPADGLVPLGRCGGQPWAPWALAWHLAWLSLPWRRGMRTPFLRWLPGRWMTVQCSCWKNRQKYRKDAISGWVLKQKIKGWHGTWMVVSFAKIFYASGFGQRALWKAPQKRVRQDFKAVWYAALLCWFLVWPWWVLWAGHVGRESDCCAWFLYFCYTYLLGILELKNNLG